MTFWNIGDEEWGDPRFLQAGDGSFEMYHKAGSWCMGQVRGRPETEIPEEWFIPDTYVRGQRNGMKLAKGLVAVGMWERVPHGYRYTWIRDGNTTKAVRTIRQREREKKARQRAGNP